MKKNLITVLALLLTATLFVTNATAQEKITGPWLWMIAPTEPGLGGAASIDIDSLVVASGGAVTEADIAANGARAGDLVGNYAWTFGEISATGGDNINECLNRIGMTNGNVDDHSSYALFQFQADTALHGVTMRVGSDDAIKVWLNGAVVHNHPVNRGASDFQDTFPVNVVAGENLLLVKVSEHGGDWSMFVGMDTAAALVRVPIVESPIQEPVQAEVSIPDAELAAVIRETLELPAGAAITADAMRNLTELYADGRGIADLTGLEHAVNLTELYLGHNWANGDRNPISNVSPLASLTNLETLFLGSTAVSDVSSLANLTNLKTLFLDRTAISDVSSLASLTNLVSLNLNDTAVDVSSLANLTNLEGLGLHGTAVSDVSSLANLTNLEMLGLESTAVSDVSSLANLTNLWYLNLNDTAVSDVSALANLTNLVSLNLNDTAVSDVSALANLTNLVSLNLNDTAVDVSSLANLTNLKRLGLVGTDVSDVSALANLTNLEGLWLNDTAVSDVSALANLTNLKRLVLAGCPLSYASIQTHIPALQAKGIEMVFQNVAHPALLKVSGDGQEGEPGAMLKTAFVVAAMDEQGEPIVGRTVEFDILGGGGRLSAKMVETDAQGKARVTLTLGSSQGVNKVRASSEGIPSWVLFTAVGTGEAPELVADVNGDGEVTRADLVALAEYYGEPVASGDHADGADPDADVNEDGVVNVFDILVVIVALDALDAAGAPAIGSGMSRLQAADVRQWLRDAKQANADPAGIAVLERLLASLMPKETLLLANYPNPFNPETWIPYQLSEPAEVMVTIYAANGAVVRTLDLGHRRAGSYDSQHRAAYWDGRNAAGEPVASGVYFYMLQAGDFSATRKMVIRK